MRAIGVTLVALLAVSPLTGQSGSSRVERLTAARALPPEIAGRFRDLADLQQAADGTYYAFDRRAHSVHRLDARWTTATRIVAIGQALGEILQPSAFASAADIFAVSDAPFALDRIQIFYKDGTPLGTFQPRERSLPRVTFGSAVMNGAGSLELTRDSVFLSEPDSGALVSEYGIDGALKRRFGHLRATGHERDADVHIGLNTGIALPAAGGGTWFVFQAGVPLLRRYDRNGELQFERHIEGAELDPIVMTLPSSWPRRRVGGARDARELPLILPNVQAAAVAPDGSLWIATTLPYVFVFSPEGEKTRVVQLQGTGTINPLSLAFSREGRLLVTPGGYEFDVSAPARNVAAPGSTR